jgi:hypothetical protein
VATSLQKPKFPSFYGAFLGKITKNFMAAYLPKKLFMLLFVDMVKKFAIKEKYKPH